MHLEFAHRHHSGKNPAREDTFRVAASAKPSDGASRFLVPRAPDRRFRERTKVLLRASLSPGIWKKLFLFSFFGDLIN